MLRPKLTELRPKAIGLRPEAMTAFPDEAPSEPPPGAAMVRPLGVVEKIHGIGVWPSATALGADRKRSDARLKMKYRP